MYRGREIWRDNKVEMEIEQEMGKKYGYVEILRREEEIEIYKKISDKIHEFKEMERKK